MFLFENKAEEWKMFSENSIVKPYGSLGDVSQINFGNYVKLENIDLINNIKVIGDERSKDNFKKANDFLSNSKSIIFIGYGFDETNNSSLGIYENEKFENISIFGTKYKIEYSTDLITEKISKNFNADFDGHESDLTHNSDSHFFINNFLHRCQLLNK